MKYAPLFSFWIIIVFTIISGCTHETDGNHKVVPNSPQGALFIIGGGKRPPEMVQELAELAKLDSNRYAIVMTMASQEPDTSYFYTKKQFTELGYTKIFRLDVYKGEKFNQYKIDSIKSSALIYITGGDQQQFMDNVLHSDYHLAVKEAYFNGTVVAGTSAGAAVMSKKMISGRELRYPEYTGYFRTIESDNIEISEGLGLLPEAIIDQHFIFRMHMNRLITAAIEHPEETCIGIDEATAIIVTGDSVRVTGQSQVIVLKSNQYEMTEVDGLLRSEKMSLSVYVAGDSFRL